MEQSRPVTSLWCNNVGMLVFLETDRLLLRQFDRRDADLLVELDGDQPE
jgi:hypothetical protein